MRKGAKRATSETSVGILSFGILNRTDLSNIKLVTGRNPAVFTFFRSELVLDTDNR